MSPDVLEVDELESGVRQEGVYAGFSVFIRKLSTGLVLSLIGPALAWSGYAEGAGQQSAQVLTTIRLLISWLPAVLLLTAIVVARSYPISRASHTELRAQLAAKRTATSSRT
jgi:GPH family glycoside/pentoside/hexuronide:cation symporter